MVNKKYVDASQHYLTFLAGLFLFPLHPDIKCRLLFFLNSFLKMLIIY